MEEQKCEHAQNQVNGNLGADSGGIGGTNYCPHCQPRCPCCGRPYNNFNYPYYPAYLLWYGQF